jgi:hypothetical protein
VTESEFFKLGQPHWPIFGEHLSSDSRDNADGTQAY